MTDDDKSNFFNKTTKKRVRNENLQSARHSLALATKISILNFTNKKKCDVACEFDTQTKRYGTVSSELNFKYKTHKIEKDAARKEKKQNKDRENKDCVIAAFDLRRVIHCTQTNVSQAYYLRKLNMYNLTACNIQQKKGYCILWHEAIGQEMM